MNYAAQGLVRGEFIPVVSCCFLSFFFPLQVKSQDVRRALEKKELTA